MLASLTRWRQNVDDFEAILAQALKKRADYSPLPCCVHCRRRESLVPGGICLACIMHDLSQPCPDLDVPISGLADVNLELLLKLRGNG